LTLSVQIKLYIPFSTILGTLDPYPLIERKPYAETFGARYRTTRAETDYVSSPSLYGALNSNAETQQRSCWS